MASSQPFMPPDPPRMPPAARLTGMNAPDFLVETIPHSDDLPRPRRRTPRLNAWVPLLVGLLLGGAAAGACDWAAGASLGLFFGGALLAGILVPPLAAAEDGSFAATLAALGVTLGTGGVWLALADRSGTSELQCSLAAATLAALALALAGLVRLLRRLRLPPAAAAALTIVLALAWLTWPLWLSPALQGPTGSTLVRCLSPAHPLFALNRCLMHLGLWTEQSIAYHLTNLSDQIPYSLPNTPWPAIAIHGALGLILLLLGRRRAS